VALVVPAVWAQLPADLVFFLGVPDTFLSGTSLFSRDRLAMLLKYSLAYVQETGGLEKHIMRYPQLFATKAITKKLKAGHYRKI